MGAFPEIQPNGSPSPVAEIIAEFRERGGLILHGEQAFEYQRPIFVGDVLRAETRVLDVYDKTSGTATMTFAVVETTYLDDATGDPVATARTNYINRR